MSNKTILITGASSGIGKAIAIYFSKKGGWNVAATMRNPEAENELQKYERVKLFKLDVTDQNSINNAIINILNHFNDIDVVCNNAGYGAVGIFEAATNEQIIKQFNTNVIGVMNVIRGILPHFRKKRISTIINITSMGGIVTFPIYSVYHATKWALEGFSESLHYELKDFNIRIKIIEPGAIKTDFYTRSMEIFDHKTKLSYKYDDYFNIVFSNSQKAGENAPGPELVAKAVYKAAVSKNFRLRYPVGNQAPLLLFFRKIFPNSWFFALVRIILEKGHRR